MSRLINGMSRMIFPILWTIIFFATAGYTLLAQVYQSPFVAGEYFEYRSWAKEKYTSISPIIESEIEQKLYTLPTYIPRDTTMLSVLISSSAFDRTIARAPIHGNSVYQGDLRGVGVRNLKDKGILKGYVGVQMGQDKRVGYSAIRQPEYYLPYLVADSSGGDFHYEQYMAGGLYSLRQGNSDLGVALHFGGEIAYKYEDPRIYNTTATLQGTLGYTYHAPTSEWSVSLHGLYHRKYMNLLLWRPSQQDKFHFTYGFGMVDVRNTPIFFGTSRMHYMGGGAVDLLFRTKKTHSDALSLTTLLSYQCYGMRTEESSSMGLFGHLTHQLDLQGGLSLGQWRFALEGQGVWRKGIEYIYMDTQPDKEHLSITDYQLIDKRQDYLIKQYELQLKAGIEQPIIPQHNFLLSLGAKYFSSIESYRTSSNKIAYGWLLPWLAVGYRSPGKLLSLFTTAYRVPLASIYRVERGYKDQLDFQLAYLPFVEKLYQGVELRWKNEFQIPLRVNSDLIICADLFYAPYRRQQGHFVYEGAPSTISSIFSSPVDIPSRGHLLGGELSLHYRF